MIQPSSTLIQCGYSERTWGDVPIAAKILTFTVGFLVAILIYFPVERSYVRVTTSLKTPGVCAFPKDTPGNQREPAQGPVLTAANETSVQCATCWTRPVRR